MEISCQTEDKTVHHQQLNKVEELSEFINTHSTTDYYLNINSITYHLQKISRYESLSRYDPRNYPKISLNLQGRILPQELTITSLDDFDYFLSQHPSPHYFLEINSIVFRMRKLGNANYFTE
ncbi:MAG: hypothetical protein HC773_24625 [Scytonema sp. CRU_2_7]|nr:hypothetical protein [Scytonema sp. CRU_2_7]